MQDTFWGRTFNAWFGRNTSHIANAYGSRIKVTFKGNQIVKVNQLGVNRDGFNVDVDNLHITGQVEIENFEYYRYDRNLQIEYMTVSESRNDANVICRNVPMGTNRSYIITSNGQVKIQKYGSRNLFLDEHGINHSPYPTTTTTISQPWYTRVQFGLFSLSLSLFLASIVLYYKRPRH